MTFWDVLYAVGGILVSSLGGATVLYAFSSWLGKVWANRILESEKAKHQKGQFVHRLQFEAEFQLYRELWGKTFEARNAVARLRPMVDQVPQDRTEDQIKEERLKNLSKAFREFQDAFMGCKPFLASNVYDAVKKLSKSINREAIAYDWTPREQENYWEEAEQHAKEIEQNMDIICEAIRARIGLISEQETA